LAIRGILGQARAPTELRDGCPSPEGFSDPAPNRPADLLRNGLPGRGTRLSHPPVAKRLIIE